MKHWFALILSLFVSAGGFGQITALGEKSAFHLADKLEPLSLWDLVDFSCRCSHLLWYPSEKIPAHKKLVVGIRDYHPKATEWLYVVENACDVEKTMQCEINIASFYFMDKALFEALLAINLPRQAHKRRIEVLYSCKRKA